MGTWIFGQIGLIEFGQIVTRELAKSGREFGQARKKGGEELNGTRKLNNLGSKKLAKSGSDYLPNQRLIFLIGDGNLVNQI